MDQRSRRHRELSTSVEVQRRSAGNSTPEIHSAALALAEPRSGLSWLDIGAGTGDVLREIRDRWDPSHLATVDVLPWLASDLRPDVEMHIGDAMILLPDLSPVDRVLAVETLEHLEAPWATLRLAARLVKPGGRLVVTTPNVTSLRHRLELALRGQLTSFRPEELQHLTPALGHVIESILGQEGLVSIGRQHAMRDVVPLAHGRRWPHSVIRRAPSWLCASLLVYAARPAAMIGSPAREL